MNNHFQKVALRFAAATSLLVGFSIVACSSSEETPVQPPPPPGSSGTAPQTGGTGGGSAQTGGTGGSGGTGTAPVCTPACTAPKLSCVAAGGTSAGGAAGVGTCSCPGYAPNFCETANKCANFTKDPAYCGNCTTACTETQSCSASVCMPELTAVGTEIAACVKLQLVADGAKLYVLNTGGGELSTFNATTGALTSVATGLTGATAFAVDATNAYVVAGMKVIKVTLAGGAKADYVTETMPIYDVTLDATSVYWAVDKPATDVDPAHVNFMGFIKKALKTAAPATGEIVGGGMDMGQPKGVAVAGANVLYASASAQNVELQKGLPVLDHDPESGDPTKIDPNHVKLGASQGSLIFGHRSVQTDGTYVYWANGTLQRSAFAAADHTQKTAATSLGDIMAYATTATTAYIASAPAGTTKVDLEKATFEAETSIWLARNLDPVTSIITDATSVYVASGCKILKTAL